MLEKDPKKRIDIYSVYEHSFFSKKADLNLEEKMKQETKSKINDKLILYQQSNAFTKAISMCMSHLKTNTSTNREEM